MVLTQERMIRSLETASDLEDTTKARLSELHAEIHAIHHANGTYWRRRDRRFEANLEYRLRQERLQHIRHELAIEL
jgi:hypothetical protein